MASKRELLDAYNALSSQLVRQTSKDLAGAFRNLGSWRDADFRAFYKMLDATMTGAKLQAARLQVAFYQEMAKAAGEKFITPAILAGDLTVEKLRNGTEAVTVYRRPFVDVYTALKEGKTVTAAIEAGALRISSLVATDIQLARRNAGFAARGKNDRIVGYARTLTGSENCALCYVASTQRYHVKDLLPIHPGCDCGEMPIYGNQDPGQVIDEIRLNATHEAIAARFGEANYGGAGYEQIAIREHGELGPMLTVADQNFTGPSDL